MHTFLTSFDFNADFWIQNPQALLIKEFKEVSNNKQSSKIMWCLFFLRDTTRFNRLKQMNEKEILSELKQTYFQDIEKHIEKIKLLYPVYDNVCLSYTNRKLIFWKRELEKREDYIKTLEYGENTKEKEELLKNTNSLWKEFVYAEKNVKSEEEKESITHGGRMESFSESKKL